MAQKEPEEIQPFNHVISAASTMNALHLNVYLSKVSTHIRESGNIAALTIAL